jgi:D-alanyl-lipoteichoic acid acyltransferase DltB (MBOAT superfamily)
MTLSHILVFSALAVGFRLLAKERWRNLVLLAASALAVYWLQPATPIRNLDFWLPTATLALVGLSWVVTTPVEARRQRSNLIAARVLIGVVALVGLTRYVSLTGLITATRPPQFWQIVIALGSLTLFGVAVGRFTRPTKPLLRGFICLLIGFFLVLKIPALATATSAMLRVLAGQSPELAAASDLRWLGFSYVSFRLIHTLHDRQSERLPVVTLAEYATYVIFFPVFTAGPIDRLERFIKDLRQPLPPAVEDLTQGGRRLAVGLFKKFVLADALALMSLNPLNATQVTTAGWAWVLLYGYSLQIYLDFSGYTDIAIGLGRLLGIKLPENFNHPYLKPNLTQFWSNWHMTLTQWFRAHFFNPLTRSLRKAQRPLSPTVIILLTQVSTMVLIGLWHGVTFNFVLWGAWHGLGLFVQNCWSEWAHSYFSGYLEQRPALKNLVSGLGTVLTFQYVALGWVWFAMPTLDLSLQVFRRLFGA